MRYWLHKLFNCPTFWQYVFLRKPAFTCRACKRPCSCYWDGSDMQGIGVNICNGCAKRVSRLEDIIQIQFQSTTGHDEYMRGLYNGLVLAAATILNIEANFMKPPAGQSSATKEGP